MKLIVPLMCLSLLVVISGCLSLGIMRRLLRSDDATVRLAVDEHRIHVHVDDGSGQSTLSSSLVEGRFPPFEDVIPKDQDKKVVFDRDALRAAVRQAALLTSEWYSASVLESAGVCEGAVSR